jgi:hypothetical protein
MTDVPGSQRAFPPIRLVGAAALEDVRAHIPAIHKAMVAVRVGQQLVIAATLGCSEDRDPVGSVVSLSDGFIGWVAASGKPQIRPNMDFVPAGAPPLTAAESSLAARSAIATVVGEDGGSFLLSGLICHGFYVFVLEDLDMLSQTAEGWRDQLEQALADDGSQAWLRSVLGPAPEPAPGDRPAQPVQPPMSLPADYTAQDVDVLLSVFGLDITTRNPYVAKVLKADVAELAGRDVRDLIPGPNPGPAASTEGTHGAAPAGASQTPEAPQSTQAVQPVQPAQAADRFSSDDVGRVLSVFGIQVKTTDSPFSRALASDVGSFFKKPQEPSGEQTQD